MQDMQAGLMSQFGEMALAGGDGPGALSFLTKALAIHEILSRSQRSPQGSSTPPNGSPKTDIPSCQERGGAGCGAGRAGDSRAYFKALGMSAAALCLSGAHMEGVERFRTALAAQQAAVAVGPQDSSGLLLQYINFAQCLGAAGMAAESRDTFVLAQAVLMSNPMIQLSPSLRRVIQSGMGEEEVG